MALAASSQAKRTSHPWIELSRAPLYVLRYPASRTLTDVIEAHAAVESIYRARQEPLAWLVDASEVTYADAKQRQAVAAHEKRVAPLASRLCVGLGLVLPNAVVRGLFTAVLWVAPLEYPFEIFETDLQAERWLRAQLAQNTK